MFMRRVVIVLRQGASKTSALERNRDRAFAWTTLVRPAVNRGLPL